MVTAYILSSTIVVPLYGKFGDLFGRKIVLQIAIVLFLVGSALCGLAQNMTQLVLMRALQGLGRGLMVISMAAVADVIPPADRGRYQGLFGGVFGPATVIGPLIGGFIVQHASRRWIFYINLPLGLFALLVIGAVFHGSARRSKHEIDYRGDLPQHGVAVHHSVYHRGDDPPMERPAAVVHSGLRPDGDRRVYLRRAAGVGADYPAVALPRPQLPAL